MEWTKSKGDWFSLKKEALVLWDPRKRFLSPAGKGKFDQLLSPFWRICVVSTVRLYTAPHCSLTLKACGYLKCLAPSPHGPGLGPFTCLEVLWKGMLWLWILNTQGMLAQPHCLPRTGLEWRIVWCVYFSFPLYLWELIWTIQADLWSLREVGQSFGF